MCTKGFDMYYYYDYILLLIIINLSILPNVYKNNICRSLSVSVGLKVDGYISSITEHNSRNRCIL